VTDRPQDGWHVRASKAGSDIQRIVVSSAQGVVLYSDDARQIGLKYPLVSAERAVLDGGRVEAAVTVRARAACAVAWPDRPCCA
jgi:hypothetical protein